MKLSKHLNQVKHVKFIVNTYLNRLRKEVKVVSIWDLTRGFKLGVPEGLHHNCRSHR